MSQLPRLYLIVFIEGFASLGAEVIALRRLVPHIGSSIVVTAPTIGFFLLALALGYAAGSRVAADFLPLVRRNFLLAAGLCGIGLAQPVVAGLFDPGTLVTGTAPLPAWFAYLLFVSGVLCPVAWLLGQTVPILSNLWPAERVGEASGRALYWSTLGSFLGSLLLSLGVMLWLGVAAAVLLTAGLLLLGAVLLGPWRRTALLALPVLALSLVANGLGTPLAASTAYADYEVRPVELPAQTDARALLVNNSTASLLDASQPPHTTRYIEHLHRILHDELGYRGQRILVLGAGGFTLSLKDESNRYTYVDIDPAIRELAERHFLRHPVRGEFIADDARRFVHRLASDRSQEPYAAVVVDVYSSHTAIPPHLVTREFWADTRHALTADGVLLVNLILDPKLQSPYARNLLATIDSVYGRCAVEVLHKERPLSNVEVLCHASSAPGVAQVYRDERNGADVDWVRSR
jgi:predicted membrane-bound spermidine synthase